MNVKKRKLWAKRKGDELFVWRNFGRQVFLFRAEDAWLTGLAP